jgi:replication factor A1
MADCITSNGVASMMANRNPDSNAASSVSIVVQVLELKRIGSSARFTTMVSDGSQKLRAALPSSLNSLAEAGQLQERGTLRILDYTFSNVAGKDVLMITKGEVVGPALEFEHGIKQEMDVKPTIRLEVKPTFQVESKAGKGNHNFRSAAQIVQDQRGNAAPASMMGISRRVYPIVSLNPYQGNWTIKVRVTSKGPLRSFKNARGAGNVFNVELTDEDVYPYAILSHVFCHYVQSLLFSCY